MATGPHHYRQAELLVDKADGQESEQAAYTIAKAQVHATLAQTAAVAAAKRPNMNAITAGEWDRTAL